MIFINSNLKLQIFVEISYESYGNKSKYLDHPIFLKNFHEIR